MAATEARAAAADAKLADAILQNARLSMQLAKKKTLNPFQTQFLNPFRLSMQLAELKLENAKLRVGRL